MKKKVLTLTLFCAIVMTGFAQREFERGYIVKNGGEKLECFIKNNEWRYSPVKIQIKYQESDSPQNVDMTEIEEFAIGDVLKYKRIITKANVSKEILPDWNVPLATDTLMLKVLVAGAATLYEYDDDVYFYSVNAGEVSQLIYKQYQGVTQNGTQYYNFNKTFQQQLFNNVNCDAAPLKSFANLDYKIRSLQTLFIKYNTCVNPSYSVKQEEKKKLLFHLRVTPGLDFAKASYVLSSPYSKDEVDFSAKASARTGLEVEAVVPYNKGKWSVVLEPTYQSYKRSAVSDDGYEYDMNYTVLEIPLGVRYRSFIAEDLTLFFDTFLVNCLDLNSDVSYRSSPTSMKSLQVKNSPSLTFGVGINYNKLSVEIRHYRARSLTNYSYWGSEYTKNSVILGYRIF